MIEPIKARPVEGPDYTRTGLNLADRTLGAEVVALSDDFFAPGERMLDPAAPVFYPDRFDDHGKWMDGWETRRRRGPGHDYCVVRLAMPGVIAGVDFDTSFFTGNYPPAVSLEACYSPNGTPGDAVDWQLLIPARELKGDDHCFCAVASDQPWTHLRVNILPDGGIARLRVFGRPWCDWPSLMAHDNVNLLAVENGADQVAWSDAHYGEPRKMLRPGRGINMGDGWETRRRREPGNDWCILALGHKGIASQVEVDTAHFKGNYPAACSIQAACVPEGQGTERSLVTQSMFWKTLLPDRALGADSIHNFSDLEDMGPITHIRFNMIPDGGVSRVRLFGKPVA